MSLRNGKQISTTTFDTYYYVNRKGHQFPVVTTISPIKNEKEIIGGISVFRDITNEKRIDQAKTEFVSLASHQLRTPLSTINWYTEMLLAGDIGKLTTEQHKYVKETYKASKRMVDLVNALLNVSRIELGTFVVEPKPMNIKEVLNEVISELQSLIKIKKTIVKVHLDVNNTYQLDRKLIHIIFQNLISNALKYTPEKGKIIVSVTEGTKFIDIQVKDNGYGIPTNQGKLIFTKLFRADNIKDKESDGTGLGLYIVKSILDQTGGSIHFESEIDKGTTFFVKIPVRGMQAKKGARQLE
jgi:signal transduction histidine kinase